GGRARLRSRHRAWRRQLSVGARRAGQHFQARCRGAQARHDPVERARLLQNRRLRHPHRESRADGRGTARRRCREAAQCLRDADACAHRPAPHRSAPAEPRRGRLARRLPRARKRRARAARRCRDTHVAHGCHGAVRSVRPIGVNEQPQGTVETPPTTAAGWRLLALLIAVSSIGPLSVNIILPALPGLAVAFSADPAIVQLTVSLYFAALGCAQLVHGSLSDRFGRRPVLLAGFTITVATSFVAAAATHVLLLVAARTTQAFGASTGIVIGRAVIRDLYARDHAASMLGWVTMSVVAVPMFGPLVGGLLAE